MAQISLDNQAGHGTLLDLGRRFNQPRTSPSVYMYVRPVKNNKTFLQAHYTRQFEARAPCPVFSFTLLTSVEFQRNK